jgi:thioredoxin-related protein
MLKKLAVVFCISTVAAAKLFAQADAEGSLVKWMTLEEAMEKEKTQSRPIVMDFYTDWCGWCKKMMASTYTDPNVAQYLNANFYPVKFNAETKDTIEYLGEKYGPRGTGARATNELAIKLLQGKMMYPTTMFMNSFDKKKNEFVFSMLAQGYLDVQKYEPMMIFTLENAFRNANFDDFRETYEKAFFDTATDRRIKDAGWKTPTEVFNKKDKSDKKIMVLIHTDWCNSCKVMLRGTFTDSTALADVKQRFELVDFNPEITDTIHFKGQAFINPRTKQMPFHQLAMALCRNSLTLPTLVIMDEQMNVLDAIPFYLTPELLKNIAVFYGDDVYKKKSWAEFTASLTKKP